MSRSHQAQILWAALLLAGTATAARRGESGALVFDNVPEAAAQATPGIDRYLDARQARPLGWTAQGQLLISTRFGEVDQLHLVEHAGADRRQLTYTREPITDAQFSPDPLRSAFAYLEDTGGDENSQLYYQRLGEPAAKRLSDGRSMYRDLLWSNAGREIAISTTARDGATFDIEVVDPESGTLPRLIMSQDTPGLALRVLDWSPDDRKLLVLKRVSAAESYLYTVDLASAQKHEVEPAPFKVAIAAARFARDGQGVFLISDRDAEVARLRYIRLFGNEKAEVLSNRSEWAVQDLALSRDGHYLAYIRNEAGVDQLDLLDLRSHQELVPPRLPAAGIIDSLSFDAQGKHLAFGLQSVNQPEDAFVLDIAQNRLEQWTRSEIGALDAGKFTMPRAVQFPSFDRLEGKAREIPAYVYEPPVSAARPVLILLPGSESPFRPGFDPWLQYVVNELGYAVIAANVRGSAGYGKTYAGLDRGTLREDAVKDVGALLVWIALQPGFDAKHVVIAGESYGGYLALAALVNYGDRLRGAVDVSGMADLVSLLSSTAAYRQNEFRAEYGDERDADTRAYLRRISPLQNAERIMRPLFVIAGKNDRRVPSSETEQIVNRLRAKNGEVWFLSALDEGHGFKKKHNLDAYYRSYAQFLAILRQ